MRCPHCGAPGSRVISTNHESGRGIRRRRKCTSCSARFTTHEQAALDLPVVIKHDGAHETFDRDKLLHGIRMACAKRPISNTTIQELASAVEDRLRRMSLETISSREVGDLVLDGLRQIDEVAYIRYALIYLELNNVDNVLTEVDRLVTIAR